MKKIAFNKKIIGIMVVSFVCSIVNIPILAVRPMIAYAQSKEVEENIVVEEPVVVETYGPLTPDGNLSLVDDYGTLELGGKQFITVVTKSGNYFYIIIDRDDQGQETVHFLNMVDESDLLQLLDEEEAKSYLESSTVAEPIVLEEEPTDEQVVELEVEETSKGSTTGWLVLILLATIGGIGAYLYIQVGKKKNTGNMKPDPDADYQEEDEDYLKHFEEEAFEEATTEEIATEDMD